MIQDTLEGARLAILQERERRDYQVEVSTPRRASGIGDTPIPDTLEAYVAETTCTVHHKSGIPCLWVDWAFHLHNGQFRVVLQNDLVRPGMFLEESVHVLFAELENMG